MQHSALTITLPRAQHGFRAKMKDEEKVAGSCEQGTEPPDFMKCSEILD
jgi:hypothetical protein